MTYSRNKYSFQSRRISVMAKLLKGAVGKWYLFQFSSTDDFCLWRVCLVFFKNQFIDTVCPDHSSGRIHLKEGLEVPWISKTLSCLLSNEESYVTILSVRPPVRWQPNQVKIITSIVIWTWHSINEILRYVIVSRVEYSAVRRVVVGSNPARGSGICRWSGSWKARRTKFAGFLQQRKLMCEGFYAGSFG